MGTPSAILAFDDGRGDLGPLSDLRASFEQRTGGRTLAERAAGFGVPVLGAAPSVIAPVVAERMPGAASCGDALCVNGRVHAPLEGSCGDAFRALPAGTALVSSDGSVVAARLSGPALAAFVRSVEAGAAALPPGVAQDSCALRLWSRPWHLLESSAFDALIAADAAAIAAGWPEAERGGVPAHAIRVGDAPVMVHASARIGAGVVFDASAGPILVDRDAEVRHGAVLCGPVFVGARSIVMDRSILKARSAIGPQCRVAGEVGSVVFQGFSNKAHDGHLGDALLGEWVNLGAGTVNSNLLNTYGEVAMRLRPGSAMERTGRQFMGCIVGDHAKLAIGTRVMTGSSIGTGAMWAAGAAVSGSVAPFAWVTDGGERRFRLDKFMEIARTVMARRGRTPGTAEAARLSALHGAGAG